MTARFWKAQSKRVARALWHKEGTEDINKDVYVLIGIPYTEEESIMIDNWAKSASVTSTPLVRIHPQKAKPLATNRCYQMVEDVLSCIQRRRRSLKS